MSLKEYNNKRNFLKTSEPEGSKDFTGLQRFVIQRHQASRLHYDLRLEIDGALKSWAVPKGPSMNPKDKRLAVQTEDHPIKYLSFYGNIPKGNYGAGHMDIWDNGTFKIYEVEEEGNLLKQYSNGNLKIDFYGEKIKGRFALVQTRMEGAQKHWLLLKKQDAYATDLYYDAENIIPKTAEATHRKNVKKLKLRTFVPPMLAETADKIFSDPNWIYEFKWDGYRMISQVIDGKVMMHSRNGISYNSKFQLIHNQLQNIPYDVILDGEVVIADENGLPQFQALQKYDENTKGRLVYYVFDLLHLNGHDTIELPLLDRKSLIPDIIDGLDHIKFSDHIEDMGIAFYERAIALGMEGVIAKMSDSNYSPGFRTKNWLKVKEVETIEAIICGYTQSNGRGKLFGSLILGQLVNGELTYIGNCGTGFNSKYQGELLKVFKPLEIEKPPFDAPINLKGRTPQWMKPRILCLVKFMSWTKSGLMRHPVFVSLSETSDRRSNLGNLEESVEKKKIKHPNATVETLDVDGIKVPITNIEKLLWPKTGYKKYDLIDYYLQVSETILPYLKDRPQSLHRHPNGIENEGFYQKDHEYLPEFVESVALYSKSAEREINYLLCQNTASLLYLANLGCIELNPWNSRVQQRNFPDYTVIDLDPSDKNSFKDVLRVARTAGSLLKDLGIKGFCKTTGKRGLHIYIPLGAKYSFEEARTFTKILCLHINERLPELTTLERSIKKRKGKLYLDYLQNRRAQTLASVYCVRPVKYATVSTPVSWSEIETGFDKNDFTIKTVPNRLENMGDLFKGLLNSAINIEQVLEKLDSI